MIAAVIRWSARNLFLVGLVSLFVALGGLYAVSRVPLDAIPDLSDVQVIVYTEFPGQAPQVVEDQVTYPLTSAMLTVPKSKVVRGFSFFGVSFVYIIFEDGTDLYWARSRVLEYLNAASGRLPSGVTPSIGPDATGVGWVYQYVIRGAQKTLAELRSLQDWHLRYGLAKAEGVAEVASVGGFVKQYSIVIDPRRLQSLGIPLSKIRNALKSSNIDVGGRTVELTETEYAVRGRGYIRSLDDLKKIVVKNDKGVPVLLQDVGRVELTPDERRGITEYNGEGEAVTGIALQRTGENALSVIEHVKNRLAELASSLPEGVTIDAVYDRSDLIYRAIETLKHTLVEESIIVALVCVVFLLHVRSALVAIVTLPLGILIAYLLMYALGLSSNIMSLGGIAIAIGAMVDAAIVMIENARAGAVLQPSNHHRFFSADLRPRSAGRTDVQAARLYEDVFDGCGGPAFGDPRSGFDGAVRARPHHAREQESGEPCADLALPSNHPLCASAQGGDDPDRPRRTRSDAVAGDAARHRIHADAERRHFVLHADHAAGALRHQGGATAADAEQDHKELPGSRFGMGQSRSRFHRDRSGADGDVRDRDQPEARERLAPGHDGRQIDR
jgi:CzcA family heavy metal efflux pump